VSDLPKEALDALDRARKKKLSYAVRMLRAPDGRTLAVLGEAHMKMAEAAKIGRDVVSAFELRGVETFQRDQIFLGRLLGVLIHGPRLMLQLLSFGAMKGSTITDARQLPSGFTVQLERTKKVPFGLHITSLYLCAYMIIAILGLLLPLISVVSPPVAAAIVTALVAVQAHMILLIPAIVLRRFRWSWMIHPLIGILTLRDYLMVDGTVRMLEDHPRMPAVVVMGRAHVSGYTRLLIDKHGFKPWD
jgi:hypothetical protein